MALYKSVYYCLLLLLLLLLLDIRMVTRKLEYETGLPDSESAISLDGKYGSAILGVFRGWHFTHSGRNGAAGLVNGSVEQSPVDSTLGTAAGQLSSRPITEDLVDGNAKSTRTATAGTKLVKLPCKLYLQNPKAV